MEITGWYEICHRARYLLRLTNPMIPDSCCHIIVTSTSIPPDALRSFLHSDDCNLSRLLNYVQEPIELQDISRVLDLVSDNSLSAGAHWLSGVFILIERKIENYPSHVSWVGATILCRFFDEECIISLLGLWAWKVERRQECILQGRREVEIYEALASPGWHVL